MDAKRRGGFTFTIEKADNQSFVASITQHDRHEQDDVGALYYVVVVILIYGCSILMMIASYIRKNKVDRKLNRYIKEMAFVRKREEQLQLFTAAAKAAALHGDNPPGRASISAEPEEGSFYTGRRFFPNRNKRGSILLPARTVPPSSWAERKRLLQSGNVRFAQEFSDPDSDTFLEDYGEPPTVTRSSAAPSLVTPMLGIVKLASLMAPQADISAHIARIEAISGETIPQAPEERTDRAMVHISETTVSECDEEAKQESENIHPIDQNPEENTNVPNSPSLTSTLMSSPSAASRTTSSSSSPSENGETSSATSSTCYNSDFQVVTTV